MMNPGRGEQYARRVKKKIVSRRVTRSLGKEGY